MKINATEATSTFPYPLNKLKGNLMDHLGEKWETPFGTFELNKKTVKWIVDNAVPSMYNENRTYVYNKAFFEEFVNKLKKKKTKIKEKLDIITTRNREYMEAVKADLVSHVRTFGNGINETYQDQERLEKDGYYIDRFQLIRDWAEERGLYDKGDTKTQFLKLMEEAGELGRAILKDDQPEFVDAIGDMVVVLTNLAHLGNTSIEACVDSAYEVISKRTGKMVNGTFVKDDK